MNVANKARHGLIFLLVIGMSSPSMAAARATQEGPRLIAKQPPTVEHFATTAEALKQVLAIPARVVAFGEYHQTAQTAEIRSSLARFTDDLLPQVAKLSTDLVVETWVADGRCGKRENKVVAEVQTTTERPPETENEIVTLLKHAQAAGVAPHILKMSCKDYASVTTKDGDTDFVKMLTLTRQRLQDEVSRYLSASLPADGKGARIVAVYGGALHNDLYPAPSHKFFTFGPTLFAQTKGQYLEVDLFVPEYILTDKHMATEPWFASFKNGVKAGDAMLIRRSERSYIIVFPLTAHPAPPSSSAPLAPQ
jgi:hypothetical protein